MEKFKKTQKSPFKVPKNYFDDLNEELDVKILEDSFSKENGFKMPENYLSHFSVHTKESKVILFNYTFFAKIAAAIILLVSITFMITKNNSSNTNLSALNETDLNYWMDDELDYNDLNYTDLEELSDDLEITDESNLQVNAILEYLEDNDIDTILEDNKINTL